MRRAPIFAGVVFLAGACALAYFPKAAARQQAQQNPPQQNPTQQLPAQQAAPVPQGIAAPKTSEALRTVVLDAAHGGTDSGARGPNGVAEKDIVLEFAQAVANSLRAQGFQVVMTREGDTDPAFDDRAQTANGQSGAIFISLHVGSAGPVGSVRTYTYMFPATQTVQGANGNLAQALGAPSGFLLWDEAQKSYVAQSGKLGDLIQVELADKFKGSPNISWSAPVYQLRSIAEPWR